MSEPKWYAVMQIFDMARPNIRGAWFTLSQAHWECENANRHARHHSQPPYEVYEMTLVDVSQAGQEARP